MLLRTDGEGKNAWHIAAYEGKQFKLKNICILAKAILTTKEKKYNIIMHRRQGMERLAHCKIWVDLDVIDNI